MADAFADPRFTRAFATPEGVDLRLQLGQAGERAGAFVIDVLIMLASLIAMTLLVVLLFAGSGGKVAGQLFAIIWLLGAFVLRVGYFTGFEQGGRAATPGKRMLGLRVVARDGGRLSGAAIVTRNALRELEVFVPLSFLAQRASEGEAGGWTALAGLSWAGVFALFPLFNRDRMRMGDLIAGTWVVHAPRRRLARPVLAEAQGADRFAFTKAQLDAYGEFELQTLADVIRRADADQMAIVAASIRRRIAWTGDTRDDAAFLAAYYAGLCAKLERGMLFGRRRADKHAA